MKRYNYPEQKDWQQICQRPIMNRGDLTASVQKILDAVRLRGDEALLEYTAAFDKVSLEYIQVSSQEFVEATNSVNPALKEAIILARKNIEQFHGVQGEQVNYIEPVDGVLCWRKSVAIEKVGLYIPGGTAPLFSTVLMLAIPALLAGCKEIVLCTPPDQNGDIHPAILYTADLLGIPKVFKVGGAQAIAAMTYGTASIPSVYKIFGPGNQFVTKAKELVQQEGIAIDMPAGPSEVLVIADETSNPEFVAADLLSQAEHGADSQVLLLSTSEYIIESVFKALDVQLEELPRKEIASAALKNSAAVLCRDIETCMDLSNAYAPEHLILASDNAEQWLDLVGNAGSVFVGNYSCESAGDYASGTNHTLPTNGMARSYSGVSLDSFVRKITFQKLNAEGIQNIGPAIELMAEAEELIAHKNAVSIRLKKLQDGTDK
jgi:histidinol dehydrogenase